MHQSIYHHRNRPNLAGPILLILAVILVTSGILAYLRFIRVPFKILEKSITLELGSSISKSPADYVLANEDVLNQITVDISQVDPVQPGAYEIHLIYDDKVKTVQVVVADTVAPAATSARQPIVAVVGQKLKAEDMVYDIKDETLVTLSFGDDPKVLVESVEMTTIGQQEINLYLRDTSGNQLKMPIKVKVVEVDQKPPQFSGLDAVQLNVGQSFDSLESVMAVDEVDGNISDQIQVEGTVNTKQNGIYTLTYTVSDSSGNQASLARLVTVSDPFHAQRASNTITVTGKGAANKPLKAVLDYLGDRVEMMGFVYQDLTTGDRFEVNADLQFRSASTAKLFVNMALYDAVKNGRFTLDHTVTYQTSDYEGGTGILQDMDLKKPYALSTLAEYAIIYSDNIAFNMIRRTVGREACFDYYESIIGHETDRKNTSMSAADGAALMKELYTSDSENLRHMVDLLKLTKFNNMLPKYLPAGIVAHKVGFYDIYYHDAGLVFAGDRPYILTVFSKGLTDSQEVIANVSKQVYDNR